MGRYNLNGVRETPYVKAQKRKSDKKRHRNVVCKWSEWERHLNDTFVNYIIITGVHCQYSVHWKPSPLTYPAQSIMFVGFCPCFCALMFGNRFNCQPGLLNTQQHAHITLYLHISLLFSFHTARECDWQVRARPENSE